MWAYERVFYQMYPLGMCGAPFENDGVAVNRIGRVMDFIPHLKKLSVGAVYFSPVFESDTHGYNTRDYRRIDTRLGTNEDFKEVVAALRKEDIKVVLDGVFNHVGRGFIGFRDVLKNREASPYKDWFYLDFNGDSPYHDGLWYEGWEGHYDLVKLNLKNPAVTDYLIESVRMWIEEFEIDGLRLDVAYLVDRDFLRRLRSETEKMKPEFFLAGEMIGGDYNQIMGEDMCHSATNYECYKGLYSSFNSMNLFEIMHSLNRQFGEENWTLYRGRHLLSFVDNHDVSRIKTTLVNQNHLPLIYTLMTAMPGIPIVYYGSEWGMEGDKKDGDPGLRPFVPAPLYTELTEFLAKLFSVYKGEKALQYGSFRTLQITNGQAGFFREADGERVIVLVNADDKEEKLYFSLENGKEEYTDLLTGEKIRFDGGILLSPYRAYLLK